MFVSGKYLADSFGIKQSVCNKVEVKPLPQEYKDKIQQMNICMESKCFDNSWRIVMSDCFPNAEYALVFASLVLPVEHAIVCVDGTFYDPTWEMHINTIGKEYIVVEKWKKTDLFAVARKSEGGEEVYYPPMISTLSSNECCNYLFNNENQ